MKPVYRCLFHPARPFGCLDSYRTLTAPWHNPGDGGARRGLGGPVTAGGRLGRSLRPAGRLVPPHRPFLPRVHAPVNRKGARPSTHRPLAWTSLVPRTLGPGTLGRGQRAGGGPGLPGATPHPEGPGPRPAAGGSVPAGLGPGRDPVRCPDPDMLTRPNFLRTSPPCAARTPVRPRSSGRPRPEAPAAPAPQACREARARPRGDRSPRKIPPKNPRVGTPEGKSEKREPGAPTCKLSERPPPSPPSPPPPPPQKGFKSVRAQRSQPRSRPGGWEEPAGRWDGRRCPARRPRPLPQASGGRARRRCHGDARGLGCPAQQAGDGDFRTSVSPPPRPRGAVALATLRVSAAPA